MYAVMGRTVRGSGQTSSYTTARYFPEAVQPKQMGQPVLRLVDWRRGAQNLFDFVTSDVVVCENVNVITGRIIRGIPDDVQLRHWVLPQRCALRNPAPTV